MSQNQQNMTFKDYHDSLMQTGNNFRDLVCERLGIAVETFYYKKRNNSWTKPEQEIICTMVGQPSDVLFPTVNEPA